MLYCKLTLAWDYTPVCHFNVSMPCYIARALARLSISPQPAPHAWIPPRYGAPIQFAAPTDTSTPLLRAVHTRLQEVIGTFIYFVRAVDSTMLVALGTLASVQSTGTTQLLNYCATHLDAILPYHTSTTVLHVHTFPNATLALALVASLSSATRLPSPLNLPVPPDAPPPPFNGTIHVHLSIIFVVPSSATEAKLGAYSSMAKKPPCFMTWAIHNQPLQSKPTMPALPASPSVPSNNANPKPWTCDFTGYAIASNKASFLCNGAAGHKMCHRASRSRPV
jgi:hypothetical protein